MNGYSNHENGPVVMIFYRGASVVAVSPQKPEYLNLMKDKTGASFSLPHPNSYILITRS